MPYKIDESPAKKPKSSTTVPKSSTTVPDSVSVLRLEPGQIVRFVRKRLEQLSIDASDLTPENYDPNVRPMKCTSFSDLVTCVERRLNLDVAFEETLATALAVFISTYLPGSHLWYHIVGPASSGKTTICDLLGCAIPYIKYLSKFTGFHSGFKENPSSTKDNSLFGDLQDMLAICKDFTTVLGMEGTARDRVFSELRDVYDGHTSNHFRNGVQYEYKDIRFSFLTAVTEEIYRFNLVHLGERFLKIQINTAWDEDGMMEDWTTPDQTVKTAMSNQLLSMTGKNMGTSAHLTEQKSMTWGFMEYLRQIVDDQPQHMAQIIGNVVHDELDYLNSLAKIIEASRAVVQGESHFRPKPASPTRSALQLAKTMVCLCIVYGVNTATPKIRRICRKIALDTSASRNGEILSLLAASINNSTGERDNCGLRISDLADFTGVSIPTVTKIINDLCALRLVETSDERVRSTGRGRPSALYVLRPSLFDAYQLVRRTNSAKPRRRSKSDS